MKNDIAIIRDLGFPGLVVGILDEEGKIDLERMREIMSICGSLEVTFHRAFDLALLTKLTLK